MNLQVQRLLVAAGLLLSAGVAAFTVRHHEETIEHGRAVMLEIAPVDPRSLMQGDYMALNFQVANALRTAPPDGRVVVKVDEKGVGRYARIDRGEPLAADEARLRYRVRKMRVRIATDAWFFQEGHARDFAAARYGELHVRPDGEALLVALRDKNLDVLGGPRP
jgi:uncharacterized membrane-anchored protein